MIEWYLKVVRDNYANFSGRARRSEYWYFILCNALIKLVLGLITVAIIKASNTMGIIGVVLIILYSFAMVVPNLAVVVRRLHDVGKSGWFYFVSFIPLVGQIWILALFCTEGNRGENKYGPDPKENYNEFNDIGSIKV